MFNDSIVELGIKRASGYYNFHFRELEILCLLATNGPLNIYQIAKRLNIEYSVAHTTIKRLETNQFVKLVGKGQGEKRVPTMIYGLTLKGLIPIMFYSGMLEKMDEVCEKWKHLAPLLFGKWKHFKESGVQEDIIQFLLNERDFWLNFQGAYTEKGEIPFDRVAELILMGRLGSWIFLEGLRKNRDKWINTFRGDEELRRWMVTELNMRYEKHKYWMQIALEDMALLKALEGKAKGDEQNVRN